MSFLYDNLMCESALQTLRKAIMNIRDHYNSTTKLDYILPSVGRLIWYPAPSYKNGYGGEQVHNVLPYSLINILSIREKRGFGVGRFRGILKIAVKKEHFLQLF